MQKIKFSCESCEAEVFVKLGDDCDDYRVEYCPCCAAPVAFDDEDE